MATALDDLLRAIAPERTLLAIERLADEALNTFPMPGARVADWDAVHECLARFYRHASGVLLGIGDRMPHDPKRHFGQACALLMKDMGPNADHTAAKMAIHGVEGGLYAVLKRIALRLAEEHADNLIKTEVAQYWNRLSISEKLQASQEYLEKYGHLLPADVTAGGAPRLRAFLPHFLQNHPELTRRLRRVGR